MHVAYGRGSVLLRQDDEIPRGKGNFWGCPGHSKTLTIFTAAVAAAFAAKVANNVMQHSVCQASANRNPENSERRRCGLSAGKEVMGGAERGRSLISTIALLHQLEHARTRLVGAKNTIFAV